VTGGANQQYVAMSSTAVYDAATHEWTESGPLHTARMEFAAAALPGGGVLVAGGLLIDHRQDGRALRSVEKWDSRTGRWSEVEPLATVRQNAVAATLADGRVLVVGGYSSWGGDPVATAELYNPRTGHWRSAGAMSRARDLFTVLALPDGGALVLGGSRGEDWAELFNAETRTWQRVDGTSPSGESPAAAVLDDGRVLVVSGRRAKLWDPASGLWARTASLPGGMWEASAVVLDDGSVLVGGGWTEAVPEGETGGCERYSSRTWRYVPGS
jgi:hypothetical protein